MENNELRADEIKIGMKLNGICGKREHIVTEPKFEKGNREDELCEHEEDILLLATVARHFPYQTIEVVEQAYIDALLEIQFLTTEQKRSRLAEIKSMLSKLRQPDEYE